MKIRLADSERQQLLSDWEKGNWHPELCESAWLQLEARPDVNSLYMAVKVQNAIAGLSNSDLNHAVAAIQELDCRWHAATLRVISSCLQLKRDDLACQLIEQQLRGHLTPARYHLLSRNPSVLSLMHEAQPDRFWLVLRRLKHSAKTLMTRSKPLSYQLLVTLSDSPAEAAPLSVAIVGNSPMLLAKTDGEEIDSHDLVIRFNNVHLNKKLKRHTGSKTNLLMLSPAAAHFMHKKQATPVVVSGVTPWHNNSRYWRRFAGLSKPSHHVPEHVWHTLVKRVNAPPSSGLLALACLSKVGDIRVRPFGLTTGEQFSAASQGLHYGDKSRPSSRHNWQAEAELVSELIHDCV